MIYDKLFDWQKKIVNDNYQRKSYGLFLDMGLGKTPISLAFAEKNKCNKVIVLTLKKKALEDEEVRGSWLDWSNSYESKLDKYNIKNIKKFNDEKSNGQIIVLNYQALFSARTEEYAHQKPKKVVDLKPEIKNIFEHCGNDNVAIILDESHMIKNGQASRSKAVKQLYTLAQRKANKVYLYLLTGTPFTVGFIDLHNQLSLLGCEITKTQFKDKFCIMGNKPSLKSWEQPIVGYKNVDEIYNLIHKYGITIKSKDVVDLPEQIFVEHISEKSKEFKFLTIEKISGNIIAKYLQERNLKYSPARYETKTKINNPFYRNIDYPEFNYLAETPGALWLRARQISIGFQGNAEEASWYNDERLDKLRDLLETYEDNYVLFYNYTPELIRLYNLCEELGYNIDVVSGEFDSEIFYNRYANQSESERLMNKKNIILMNFATGSAGGNYQLWNHCIIFSTPLYKDWAQGIKRVHRIGSKEPVFYHVFRQDNWIENKMNEALKENIDYSEEMFKNDLFKFKEDEF